MANETVKEIISKYLEEYGYDGLYSDECGCKKDDLGPCGLCDEFLGCKAGYINKCNPETCSADGDCEWHIGQVKEIR